MPKLGWRCLSFFAKFACNIRCCDSVSAFSGKGTSKVFDPVSKNLKFRQTFCRVGDSFDISIGLLLDVEMFICVVYGLPSIFDINEVRFILFCKYKYIQCHLLPPVKDVLQKHIQRGNCQAAVWKRAFQSIFCLPSAESGEWVIGKNMLSIN